MSTQDHLPFAFDLADRTVPAMLAKQADRFGDKRLAVCGEVTWSYREAPRVAACVAGTLRAAGVGFGDRIGVMCGNRAENLALFLAAGWIGAITVPINTASKGPQIEYYLKNSAARLFIVEAEYLPLLDQAGLSGLPLERIWVIGESAPGGRTALPLPLTPAPRPIPLFRVVRIGKAGSAPATATRIAEA